MTKELTKEQFRQMAFPIVEGKNIIEPKIQLLPGDKCLTNGNIYKIYVREFEDLVTLEKINDN